MKIRTANTIRGRPIRKRGNVHVSGIKRNWRRKISGSLLEDRGGSASVSGRGYAAYGIRKSSGMPGRAAGIPELLRMPGRAAGIKPDAFQGDVVLRIMEEEVIQDLDPETRQAFISLDPVRKREILERAQATAMKGFGLESLNEEAQALSGKRSTAAYRKEFAIRNQAVEMARHFRDKSRKRTQDAGRYPHGFDTPDFGTDAHGIFGSNAEGSWNGRPEGQAPPWNREHENGAVTKNKGAEHDGRLLSRYRRALSVQIRRLVRQEIGVRLSMQAAAQKRQKGEYQKAQEEAARELRGTLTGLSRSGRRLGAAALRQLERIGRAIKGGSLMKAGFMIVPLLIVMVLMNMIMAMVSFVPSANEDEPTYGATASEIVAYALQWVGVTKYIWGAGREYETDWQDYADCSSFVHGVFSHFGIETGGDTYSMEDDGTMVANSSLDEALPGDIILFFSGSITPGNSYHVGLYIGEGQMVHCTGGRSCVSPDTAGPGVLVRDVYGSSYQVRRIVTESVGGGVGTGGHRVDPTHYSQSELETIWAVVAQEDNGSYEGALAVISCAMNRTESPSWSYLGSTAMEQLTAPGQFCYSMDSYWIPRLGGNVPAYVKQAVADCLQKGIRNHSFTSFRSTKGKTTGDDAVQIGGNWFFGH